MKVTPFKTFEREISQYSTQKYDSVAANKFQNENAALKGVILNTYIKKNEDYANFDTISTNLLIPEQIKEEIKKEENTPSSFNVKKALKPLLIATGAIMAGTLLLSSSAKLYSKQLVKGFEPLPGDLPRSMNLLEEPDLAIFRALRDPSSKNILGLIGVGIMSGATLVAKNFVDGFKDIWIKKQECDINHDLQENLISVETEAFAGKLNVVNTLLSDTTKYFKEVLSSDNKKEINFQNFLSFKGDNKKTNQENKSNNNLKTILGIGGAIAGFVGLIYLMFNNYQKTIGNLDQFKQRMTHNEIANKIQDAVKKQDLGALKNILKLINATETTMREHLSKITSDENIISKTVDEIKKSEIYAQAPEALAGVSEKIQYYCYVNEPRGHLYNWILNPENKFNKFLFLSLATSSALSYVISSSADAIKSVAVAKENSNSELSLRKKLVETEVKNFKSKKLSAINPLIENFKMQAQKGKSKQELKEMAENILIEIKNGPPYVYS